MNPIFDILKKSIDDAEDAIRACEAGKPTYKTQQATYNRHLENAKNAINSAVRNQKRAEGDSKEVLNQKIQATIDALKQAREEQLYAAKVQGKMDEYLKDTVEEGINNAMQKVFKYRSLREKMQRDLVNMKMEIAGASTQLIKYLAQKDMPDTVAKIETFLRKLQQSNFYEMDANGKKVIADAFEDATDTHIFSYERGARKGLHTTYTTALNEMLDDAINYTKFSKRYWYYCHQLREKLENNKYTKALREELGVDQFEDNKTLTLGDLKRSEKRLVDRVVRYAQAAGGSGQELLKEVLAVQIPKEIDWLKNAYNLANWVYQKKGEAIGEKIGLPKEQKLEKIKVSVEYGVEVDIPAWSCGVAAVGFEFGAKFGAEASINGSLKLHNFFSAEENTIVSGSLGAAASVSATASVGIYVSIVELIKATGAFELTAKAEATANAKVHLDKQNIEGYPAFILESDAGLCFDLSGCLVAKIGLTAPVKTLLKAVGIKSPQAEIKSKAYVFFKAERTAKIGLELPLRKKPTHFPRETFTISSGEWEYTFVAQQQLTEFWETHFGGRGKWAEVKSSTPLSPQEIQLLHQEYSEFGVRARRTAS